MSDMYQWLPLPSIADLEQLAQHISREYEPAAVAKKLAGGW
jgi:hypothetical protein